MSDNPRVEDHSASGGTGDQPDDPTAGSTSIIDSVVYLEDGTPVTIKWQKYKPGGGSWGRPGAPTLAGLYATTEDGQRVSLPTGGSFYTASGRIITFNGAGKILPGTGLPQKESSSGGGRSTAEDMALASQAADLEIMIHKAENDQDTEMQLFLLRERAKIDADTELVRQAYQEKQNALDRENSRRTQAMSEAGQLTRQALDLRQRARETLANLAGQDPLRAGIALSGGVMAGRSPAQGMRSELTQAAYAPLPQIDAQNAPLDQVEAAIANLQNKPAQLPAAPAVVGAPGATAFGLAGGGEVKIEQDALTPNTSGPTGVGIMVGEKGPELIEVTDKGFRVIPILRRAAGGLSVMGGGFSSSLDRGAMSSTLAPRPAVTTMTQPTALATPSREPAPAPVAPAAPTPQSASLATMPAPEAPVTPSGLATGAGQTPSMTAVTPAQKTFLDGLAAKGTAVDARDAAVALQLGLTDLGNVILRYAAGTATYEEVKQAIAAAYGSQEPPAPTPTPTPTPTPLPGAPPNAEQRTALGELRRRIMAGYHPTSTDALIFQQLGLREISDAILQYAAGTMTLDQLSGAISRLLSGVPAPLPGTGSEVQFLDKLAQSWPTITQHDANLMAIEADRLGLAEIKQILLTYANGHGTEEEKHAAFLQLMALLPGLRPDEIPVGADGKPLYTPDAMRQAIQALWTELGISQIPTTETGALGSPQFTNPTGDPNFAADTLRAFGISPRLFRMADTGQVFIIDEQGKAHAITSPGLVGGQELANVLKVDPSVIMEVTAEEFANFTSGISDPWPVVGGSDAGSNLRDRILPLLGQFLVNPNEPNRPYPLLAQTMVEPATGLMLPLPRMIAAILPRLNPATQQLIYQAYQAASIYDVASFERERLWFTPQGKGSASQGSFLG